MEHTIKRYRIASARLKEYDYSTPNWYFVTINTKDHHEYFGEIKNSRMYLNDLGKIVNEEWLKSTKIRKNIELDYYVIMPNHFHGILIITETVCKDVARNVSTNKIYSDISPVSGSLSAIIRGFKSAVTNQIHNYGEKHFSWQPRFYDRIIRNERELNAIRNYIGQNPLRWELDYDKETLEF